MSNIVNLKYNSASLKLNQSKYYRLKQWHEISDTLVLFRRILYLKNVIILFTNYLYGNMNIFTKFVSNIFLRM